MGLRNMPWRHALRPLSNFYTGCFSGTSLPSFSSSHGNPTILPDVNVRAPTDSFYQKKYAFHSNLALRKIVFAVIWRQPCCKWLLLHAYHQRYATDRYMHNLNICTHIFTYVSGFEMSKNTKVKKLSPRTKKLKSKPRRVASSKPSPPPEQPAKWRQKCQRKPRLETLRTCFPTWLIHLHSPVRSKRRSILWAINTGMCNKRGKMHQFFLLPASMRLQPVNIWFEPTRLTSLH